MKTLTKLQKEIKKYKSKLQKQLNKGIIYENFGAKECRELKSKYGFLSFDEWFSTDERNFALNLIEQFEEWCRSAGPIALYKKGNKYHLVEHLYDDKPNGIIEVFDTKTEAQNRIAEMQEEEERILKSRRTPITLTGEDLENTGKKIGSMGFGDCLSEYIIELWQKDYKFYEREIYIAGDDDGYDRAREITEEEARKYIVNRDFCIENSVNDHEIKWLIYERRIKELPAEIDCFLFICKSKIIRLIKEFYAMIKSKGNLRRSVK